MRPAWACLQLTTEQLGAWVRRGSDGQVTLHFWVLPCCVGMQATCKYLLSPTCVSYVCTAETRAAGVPNFFFLVQGELHNDAAAMLTQCSTSMSVCTLQAA